jgi:vacuolar-type H+-ATPase subunit E/Vma4
MGFTELKEKIINDAMKNADGIAAETNEEILRINKKADEEIKSLLIQIEKEADREAKERYQNIVTLARVNSKNKILETRQKVLDDVFTEVYKKLTGLSTEQFRNLVKSLLAKYPPSEHTQVIVGKKNRSMIDKNFIDQLNREIKSSGKFELADTGKDFDYGVYLETAWVEVDLTFAGIIRTVRENMEMDVINTLFGKGQL